MLTATPEADPQPALRPRSGWTQRLQATASRPVSAESVAVFRIGFGLLVAFSSIRFLAKGWVDTLYLEPANHLTYRDFGWVEPLPGLWMHLVVAGLALLGLAIAAGYRHRLSTGLFVIGFAYTELIEASLYLNHYWFVTLAAILLWLLPVQNVWSLDARAGRVNAHSHVPAGALWALKAQLAVVYVFAGIAKLNADWLFDAQPMRLWLADRTDIAVIGPLLDEPIVAFVAAWSGALFDCTIVGWLLWRRTRPAAYATLVIFHLATGALFQIGVFPWVMIVSTLVFFEPDWPRRVISRLGVVSHEGRGRAEADRAPVRRWALVAIAALAVVQLILPLRHYAAPGNVRWNEDGYYLSWRVMLTEKAGHVDYQITDQITGKTWEVGPDFVLTDWQANHAATRPDLIHATAHLLAEHYTGLGITNIEVRADAWVSMNGRPASPLIDPTIDLAAHERGELPTTAVLDP